jgi:hypothetical protein
MSTASLSRHRSNHISAALTTIAPIRSTAGAPFVERMEVVVARLEAQVSASELGGKTQQFVLLVRELRMALESIAKAQGELDERPVVAVNIQQSAEWVAIKAVVLSIMTPPQRIELASRLEALTGK